MSPILSRSCQVYIEPIEGPMAGHIIVVPDDVAEGFNSGKGSARILCSINGADPFHCALSPRKGRYAIIASKQLIRKHKLEPLVPFRISITHDPHNGLDLPAELAEVLMQDEFGSALYDKLKDGQKRGFIYYVRQGKSVDTRIKRSLDVLQSLKQRK